MSRIWAAIKRFWPLVLLAALAVLIFALGGYEYLGFDALKQHETRLRMAVANHPYLASLGFVGIYAAAAALALPGAIWLTLASGLVFGIFWGGTLSLMGAMLGASILFLAARTALADFLLKRAGPKMQKVQAGFVKDAASWMLILRLVPLFPFFLVNLGAALAGVRLWVFVWTSLLGMAPAVYIYAGLGNGLAQLVRAAPSDAPPGLNLFARLDLLLPLLGLAVLASLPMLWRRWRAKRARAV